jgi:hypothetical protein
VFLGDVPGIGPNVIAARKDAPLDDEWCDVLTYGCVVGADPHVPVPPEKGARVPKEGLTGAMAAPVSPLSFWTSGLITEEEAT